MRLVKAKISNDIHSNIDWRIRNKTNILSTHIRRYSNLRSISDLLVANLMPQPTSLKYQNITQNSKIVLSKEGIWQV